MGERKTVPQESKLIRPSDAATQGEELDLKDVRFFEAAGGTESGYRIALYVYGGVFAIYWLYNNPEERDEDLDRLYEITGWKRPGSLQPSTRK